MALAAMIALFALIGFLARSTRRTPALPVRSKPILTRAEIAFYERLVRALDRIGGVDVFPQVCMSALIETLPGLDSRERMFVRNKFNRKFVDFTIVDAATRPLLIVELDDSTHDLSDNDVRRDQITGAAGIPTLRIRGRDAKNDMVIEQRVRDMLPS